MLVHPWAKKSVKKIFISLFALLTLSTIGAMKEKASDDNMLAQMTDPTYNELNPVVHDAEFAFQKLKSYYKFWYRIARAIIGKKSKVCLLKVDERQRLCVRILICVIRDLQDAKFKNLLAYMEEQRVEPKPCRKEGFRTPKKIRGIWKSRKSMIFCPPFNYRVIIPTKYGLVEGWMSTPSVHVSAAQEKNAVFVFMRDSATDNLEITNYVEKLTFEPSDVKT